MRKQETSLRKAASKVYGEDRSDWCVCDTVQHGVCELCFMVSSPSCDKTVHMIKLRPPLITRRLVCSFSYHTSHMWIFFRKQSRAITEEWRHYDSLLKYSFEVSDNSVFVLGEFIPPVNISKGNIKLLLLFSPLQYRLSAGFELLCISPSTFW